jgi:hypothetical protein
MYIELITCEVVLLVVALLHRRGVALGASMQWPLLYLPIVLVVSTAFAPLAVTTTHWKLVFFGTRATIYVSTTALYLLGRRFELPKCVWLVVLSVGLAVQDVGMWTADVLVRLGF